ncbi:3-hydroxyacyl-CoA dehydrogenase family protein [Streptomyces sp. NPDC058066]|uniref:3-hydroxyacyl-CoA dehydrogenase family protein n=1 Tax=Streptomyces sp. NPDC058066 TaxID=3346323 RepID=UPI0036EBD9CF
MREAVRILNEGISQPHRTDEIVRDSFILRLPFFGPFAIADISGLDTGPSASAENPAVRPANTYVTPE